MKIFLGGTCNKSDWRNTLIPKLEANNIDYFNPVVEDWTDECKAEEERQKDICDVHLYHLTPKITGVYSIAELVSDAILFKGMTIFSTQNTDGNHSFTTGDIKSIDAVKELVKKHNALVFQSIDEVLVHLICNNWLEEVNKNVE